MPTRVLTRVQTNLFDMAQRFRLVLGAIVAFIGCMGSLFAQESAGWQVVKVGGRDYLSARNIADFYRLQGGLRLVDNRLIAGNEHAGLEFGSNPREVYINGVKQWLSFPTVVQNGQTLVSRFDLAKTIEPCLRPAMVANLQPFHTVVIDAGHGGNDRGASSTVGFEKTYTLSVIDDLKKSLEARGMKVILTRADDSYLPLEGRAQKANDTADAVFVSVHFNSESSGATASGFEIYAMTPRGAASTGDSMITMDQFKAMPGNDCDDASLVLATCVQHSLLGHLPEFDRGVRRARFAVLRLTRAPAILVEGGFLTNGVDSQKINDPVWRQKLSDSITQGVLSFQELADHKYAPKLLVDYRSEQLPLTGTIVDPAALALTAAVPASPFFPVSNPAGAAPRVGTGTPGAVPAEAR